MHTAYLLTGSNQGNTEDNLQNALQLIQKHVGEIPIASSVYRTAAWGLTTQPAFLNQVIKVETNLNPQELLKQILEIETQLGRIRTEKWKERIIDIDILFYNDWIVKTDALTLPHPFLHQRKFTLIPLNEIASGFIHPGFNKSILELLKESTDDLKVEKLSN